MVGSSGAASTGWRLNATGPAPPLRARVIDFKNDVIEPTSSETHAERYRSQLESYRDSAAARFSLSPDEVGMTLLMSDPGLVVVLD